jgi:transcriptional regulator with XRE-family HTH domain
MTLEQYRSLHRLTYRRLADLIGLRGANAVRTLHRYAAGQRFPPPIVLRRIREVTGTAVTADDFVNQHTSHLPSQIAPARQAPGRAEKI